VFFFFVLCVHTLIGFLFFFFPTCLWIYMYVVVVVVLVAQWRVSD
jgi:hypothetical protein